MQRVVAAQIENAMKKQHVTDAEIGGWRRVGAGSTDFSRLKATPWLWKY